MNQKRTVKGSQLVAIGLISVFATSLLLQGFSSEISVISSQLNSEDLTYIVQTDSNKAFNEKQTSVLKDLESQYLSVEYGNFEQVLNGFLSTSKYSDIQIPVHITNDTYLLNYIGVTMPINGSRLITSDIQAIFELVDSEAVQISIQDVSLISTNSFFISSDNSIISSGVYISNLDIDSFNPTIFILKVSSSESITKITSLISQFGLQISLVRSEGEFSQISANNIQKTLFILQIAVSVLVFLSIANLMNLLILESKPDIKILLSIGYSYHQVWIIFLLIGIFIGLIGAVLTLLISLALVISILSLFSSIGLPFVIVELQNKAIIEILINSISITFISSSFPSYRGVRNSL